jgi:transposase
MQFGLLKASFIPPVTQRELRELTRYRSTFIQERVNLVNRVQKVLESANIKLASVASDVMGISGRAVLESIVQGNINPEAAAELTKALEGRVKPYHQFVLSELLCQIDSLDEAIARFDEQIEVYCRPFEEAVQHLDTISGESHQAAEVIISEIGTDMSHFETADHLAARAGVAPGNNENAGKRYSGKTRKGNKPLGIILNQVAHEAVHAKNTYLSANTIVWQDGLERRKPLSRLNRGMQLKGWD